jgi:hypothetical protein
VEHVATVNRAVPVASRFSFMLKNAALLTHFHNAARLALSTSIQSVSTQPARILIRKTFCSENGALG